MKRSELAEVKRQHVFSGGPGGDRSACSCGWDRGSRVGSAKVAREHHKQHVAGEVEAASQHER